MDSDDAPRSRPLPWLLLAAALSLAVAAYVVLNSRMPGRSYTFLQAGQVRAVGHRGAVRMSGDCVSCHR